ncbi:MAG: exonuclease SbcCD subunit D [Clostridia bacterium]|nr:exonuclease SbcCD subunit D [Clostridia bacterium]MBR3819138.1 exonuclease SbcCD subunit D [Clostridia bacterium]
MKFLHLSDLHIGKRVNEFSMLEDQEYMLTKIINIIDDEKPDAVVIAGDVYDKSVPSAEAVQLFDDFLCRLAQRKLQVFVISGNHDSAERMAFGGRLMDISGVHMAPVYNGKVEPISLDDEFGKVNFFMLPFVKPANVRRFFEDAQIESYTDAVRVAVENMNVNADERNVIVTHQFVTGAEKCESEEISVGGSDNVDASVFDCFDYVALGHIHGPQNIGSERVRYCGTPLKYSFSEAKHKKSVTVVEMGGKGSLETRTVALDPKRDMREIKGTYAEITLKENYINTNTDDYMHITLTDEEDIPDAIGKLRVIYPNLMKLDYDNKRTRSSAKLDIIENIEQRSPLDLFAEFYEKQNNQPMTDGQSEFMKSLIESIWEGEK